MYSQETKKPEKNELRMPRLSATLFLLAKHANGKEVMSCYPPTHEDGIIENVLDILGYAATKEQMARVIVEDVFIDYEPESGDYARALVTVEGVKYRYLFEGYAYGDSDWEEYAVTTNELTEVK